MAEKLETPDVVSYKSFLVELGVVKLKQSSFSAHTRRKLETPHVVSYG